MGPQNIDDEKSHHKATNYDGEDSNQAAKKPGNVEQPDGGEEP
jgi:hypothetical protein